MDWVINKRPSVLGMAAGAVAGLVAITPAAGFVTVPAAIIIGFAAGILCFSAIKLKNKLKIDDALDVFAVHGVGGIVDAIAVGIFATVAVNSAGVNGLFYGNPNQLFIQLIAVVSVWIYSMIVTFIILKAVDWVVGTRVGKKDEMLGLDISQHGENAYRL